MKVRGIEERKERMTARARKRERTREEVESLHLLVDCSDGCNGQNWAKPKSGARSFPGFLHAGGKGANHLHHVRLLFQAFRRELEQT